MKTSKINTKENRKFVQHLEKMLCNKSLEKENCNDY